MEYIRERLDYVDDLLGAFDSALPEIVRGRNAYLGDGVISISSDALEQELIEELTHYVHSLINPAPAMRNLRDLSVRSTLTEYLGFYVAASFHYPEFLSIFQSDPRFDNPVDSVIQRTLESANAALDFNEPFAIGHGLGYGLARLSLLDGIDKDHLRVVARMNSLQQLDAILQNKVVDYARHTMYNMFAVPKDIVDGHGLRNEDFLMYWE